MKEKKKKESRVIDLQQINNSSIPVLLPKNVYLNLKQTRR